MQTVKVVQESARPLPELFDALADHNRLNEVFGIPVRRVRDGADEPNGVGSVRLLGLFVPLGIEETVTAIEPNRSIEYKITRGGYPVRNHSGRIDFASDAQGSRVTWTISFDCLPVAGTLVAQVLNLALKRGLKRIA